MRNGNPGSIPLSTPFLTYGNVSVHTSRCQVLAGGFLSATLATFTRSLPVPLEKSGISLHRPLRGTPRCAPWHREPYADAIPYFRNGPLSFHGGGHSSTRYSSRGMSPIWRKREGIEPTGDIAASRPDLKSGGATSAPSASVRMVPPRSQTPGNLSPRAHAEEGAYFFSVSFCRRFLAFSFLFLRRRISRFRSVVISAPLHFRVETAPPL